MKHDTSISGSPIPWSPDSTLNTDWTLHQLAPYIGRMKTSIAQYLIEAYSNEGDTILDPFCGSGVVPLEAYYRGRNIIANDWNPYGYVLTDAKLFPPDNEANALCELAEIKELALSKYKKQDLRKVPSWVRVFFNPKTLKETLAYRDACVELDSSFHLACLLGILHHQRPGFLSYPSSHLVPYLRNKKFPRDSFPEMYEYRDCFSRLKKKIIRTYKRFPENTNVQKDLFYGDAKSLEIDCDIQAVITSPPYMNKLDYVRDNRLRLWFINKSLPEDKEIRTKQREIEFRNLMELTLGSVAKNVKRDGYIVLLLGDVSKGKKANPVDICKDLFSTNPQFKNFSLINEIIDLIPDIRRSRRDYRGTKTETALIFQKQE